VKTLGLSLIMGLLVCSHFAFGQIPTSGQQHIPQSIVINGQQVQGVMVVQNGTVQSYTCPSPQQYVTPDQSSSGWACFEETTGVWLLHAQPPQQTTTTQQAPTIVYSQPTPVYVPAPTVPIYSYPYNYFSYGYPYYSYFPYYSYPFFVGPRFGFGFGAGFRTPFFVNSVNRSVVINRPVVISRPIGINRPIGIGRPIGPVVASRPSGGFRSAAGARAARR
jgi:hypothetical protein